MSVASSEEFVEMIGKSGLIAKDHLEQFLTRDDGSTADPNALSEALVAEGLLTSWQSDKLLAGKHRGFFLGNYKILAPLGVGGMGRVYLAEHRVMRHRVAIKTMAKRHVGNDAYLKRFEQEARAAATVEHPRVVRAFDFDTGPDLYFIVMEYVDGEDLHKIIERDGIMHVSLAAECIRQTAEGLQAIHNAGLVHRDIKPGNLIVDSQGNVRILDLGLARVNEDDASSLTLMYDAKMIGTVDYLAPEQARNSHNIDHRADLYSLGCTFYFLLTGRPPFVGGTTVERVLDHQIKPPIDVRELRPEVPAGAAKLCHKLLAKDPDDRIQTAAEVVAALADWLQRQEETTPLGGSPAGSPASLRASPAPSPAGQRRVNDQELTLAEDGNETHAERGHSAVAARAPTTANKVAQQATGSRNDLRAIPKAVGNGASKANRSSHSGRGPQAQLGSRQVSPAKAVAAAEDAAGSGGGVLLDDLPPLSLGSPPLSSPDFFSTSDDTWSDPFQANQQTLAPAVMPATATQPKQKSTRSWSEIVQSFVATQEKEGVSYALWFLIAAGIGMGILVCMVGYSYIHSTKETKVIKNRASEGASQGSPAGK
ncbi:MAG: serine/threonine protein kinase [Pirellulaceae bacterium]